MCSPPSAAVRLPYGIHCTNLTTITIEDCMSNSSHSCMIATSERLVCNSSYSWSPNGLVSQDAHPCIPLCSSAHYDASGRGGVVAKSEAALSYSRPSYKRLCGPSYPIGNNQHKLRTEAQTLSSMKQKVDTANCQVSTTLSCPSVPLCDTQPNITHILQLPYNHHLRLSLAHRHTRACPSALFLATISQSTSPNSSPLPIPPHNNTRQTSFA